MELTQACQPLGAREAREMGFLDDAFGEDAKTFEVELRARAARLAQDPELRAMLRKKHERRLDDENIKALASYRAEELERMKVNFFGPAPPITRLADASSSRVTHRRSKAERLYRPGPSRRGRGS